ncbi:hypothetical protein [Pseudomonas indica]|jgi:hypothetical protein|uniref:Uncharacterized protein n=1 Tax=Pseudomonas indica TaxID=137658 RepID=A0A1G9HHP5_9PSED|nr:hypothetical protein [Pseudomonas indica]MBU3054603.1 hypothetical protein [Pseudomonas indica]SDL12531.1 hypothetical protein SAMN05216186_11547 [Pseudomonas indica]
MPSTAVHDAIVDTLYNLQQSYDLVITSSQPERVHEALYQAVQAVSPNLLSRREYAALRAAARLLCSGHQVDDHDFELHVGLSRAELHQALVKLEQQEMPFEPEPV